MKITNPEFENDELQLGDIVLFAGDYYVISKQEYKNNPSLYNLSTNTIEESFESMEQLMEYFDDGELKKIKSLTIGG